uniref:Adenosine 3'-phospho 5'-phosphosulfate transporter 2 n=1 Tax=Panagrolaimus davidi TaxID=227884 RepID=A0A914PF26_9BILA
MISVALIADAIIGNVQEKSMKHYGAQNNEVVLFSYSIGCIYIFAILFITGELSDGFEFYLSDPWQIYGYSIIFSLLGYAGINVVLTLIRISGALTTVTVTTARKAVTIIISFLLFSKPFTFIYVLAGLFVLAAIYMNLYSKNKTKMNALIASRLHRL